MKHLFTLLGLFFALSSFAQGYSKQTEFIMGGEAAGNTFAYKNGFLITSVQGGNPTAENTIRKIDGNDSVERNIRFDAQFTNYFHPVVTTTNNIFVFGCPTYATSQEVNYVIMDSNFTVLQQKKLLVPFNVVYCKFFKAKDGGVIGIVHEVCNESRIFRLDQNGNLLWIHSYVGIIVPPGGYDRTIVNSINLMANNHYLITGHLGFGYGLFFLTINDYGTILNSKIIETVTTGTHSDVMWHTTFDGQKVACNIDNSTNGRDTTFILEVDTALNVLNCVRIIYSDSTSQVRSFISTPTEFIIGSVIGLYPPYQTEMIITGLSKATLQPDWAFSTQGNNTGDFGFYGFAGVLSTDKRPTYFYNAGPMNLSNNGGNNYDYWTMVKLDTVQHLGFCDKMPTTVQCINSPATVTTHYIDTIPFPACSVITSPHITSSVANGDPEPECNFTIGITESENAVVKMYPNPTTGMIYFDAEYASEVKDVNGNVVSENTVASSLNLSNLSAGIYFITLRDAEGNSVARRKLIKE